jgi:hypothetical protein
MTTVASLQTRLAALDPSLGPKPQQQTYAEKLDALAGQITDLEAERTRLDAKSGPDVPVMERLEAAACRMAYAGRLRAVRHELNRLAVGR